MFPNCSALFENPNSIPLNPILSMRTTLVEVDRAHTGPWTVDSCLLSGETLCACVCVFVPFCPSFTFAP
jgi:hypothetical protein